MRRAREEGGFAVVAAMAVLVVMLLVGGVVVASATTSQGESRRDAASKRALQAAETAAEEATYLMNALSLQGILQTAAPCLAQVNGVSGSVRLQVGGFQTGAGLTNWCPGITQVLPDEVQATFYVSAFLNASNAFVSPACPSVTILIPLSTQCTMRRDIVAVGTYRGVRRRLRVRVQGTQLLSGVLQTRFRRMRVVECPPDIPSGGTPSSGCPAVA